ncbi:MAG: hypothetical protein V1913_02650 [Fibrobacterota bacterium]
MAPRNKIPVNSSGSKGNLTCPSCPYCGFSRCWKHGKYSRKGFHHPQAAPPQEPEAVQRYLCRSPPCGRTFSVLPQEVLPYCRFYLSGLFSIAKTLEEGWSAYWVAKHQWALSLRVILRAYALIQKATLWLEGVCREADLSVGAGLESLVSAAQEAFSWFGFTRRWFHGLYPRRAGKIFNPHNLGIKRF